MIGHYSPRHKAEDVLEKPSSEESQRVFTSGFSSHEDLILFDKFKGVEARRPAAHHATACCGQH